jgi:uridine monophosphate synthetase
MHKEEIIRELFRVEAVKFGNFTLKSGQSSPVYVDLRTALTYPTILHAMSAKMVETVANLSNDFLVGVPYTAWLLATCISLLNGKQMLLRRKEAKTYGTQNVLHGNFKAGQSCLVIEDVVTTGGSVLETIEDLQSAGLIVHDVLTFIDREQGASDLFASKGLRLHSVLTLKELLDEK